MIPINEQPYPLPYGWHWYRLGAVAKYINGRAFKPTEWEKTGKPIIRIQNLTYSSVICNRTTKTYDEKFLIKRGNLLFSWSATLGAYIWQGDDAWLNQHIFKVIPNDGVEKSYLYYYLILVTNQLYEKAHGSGMVHITLKPFKETKIPLPPFDEQQRIVDLLDELFAKLDEAKALAQAVVDGSELRRAAILHKAFNGELSKLWRDEHGITLDSWQEKNLKDVVTRIRYGTSEKSDYNKNDFPVLRIPNISDSGIDFSDLKYLLRTPNESRAVQKDDILIVRSNGSRELVGKCALIPELKQKFFYASFLMCITPSKNVYAKFLLCYLNSKDARSQMFIKAKSSAGINNINSKELGAVRLYLPPPEEQKEIVRLLDDMLGREQRTKDLATKTLERIDLFKKSILARAFRGELDTTRHKGGL